MYVHVYTPKYKEEAWQVRFCLQLITCLCLAFTPIAQLIFPLPSANNSDGCGLELVSQPSLLPCGRVPLAVLSGLHCCNFPLTLITGEGKWKRCPPPDAFLLSFVRWLSDFCTTGSFILPDTIAPVAFSAYWFRSMRSPEQQGGSHLGQ